MCFSSSKFTIKLVLTKNVKVFTICQQYYSHNFYTSRHTTTPILVRHDVTEEHTRTLLENFRQSYIGPNGIQKHPLLNWHKAATRGLYLTIVREGSISSHCN